MDPESIEMAEASFNVLLAHFHRYHKQFKLTQLLEECLPEVRQLYGAISESSDLVEGATPGWLQQLGEVGWFPRPTFCAS